MPLLTLTLNRSAMALSMLLLLSLLALSSVTVYKLLDGTQAGGGLGLGLDQARSDSLALLRNSAATREQEQEKLIKLGDARLQELQQENAAQKKELGGLQARLSSLTAEIKSLQELAAAVTTGRAPNGTGADTGSGSGAANSPPEQLGVPAQNAVNNSGLSQPLDSALARAYAARFALVASELDSLNSGITNSRYNIATQDVQVQNYSATLSQQKSLLGVDDSRQAQQYLNASNDPPAEIPASGLVTSRFGMRWSPFAAGVRQMHYGLDISLPEGTPILATKAGVVSYTGYDPGYGNRVEVTHAGGWRTLYGHNSRLLVKVGQPVRQGEVIAQSGNTGASTGPHTHYEIYQNGLAVDPARFIKKSLTYQQ